MWMLVRRNAIAPDDDGALTLAACPDSPDRGDPWLWSVRVVGALNEGADAPGVNDSPWQLAVDHDPDHITTRVTVHADETVAVARASGEEVVVVPLSGEHLVAHATGPWQRWITPGDVFIVEGEDTEDLRLSPSPSGGRLALVRLRRTSPDALRWVP